MTVVLVEGTVSVVGWFLVRLRTVRDSTGNKASLFNRAGRRESLVVGFLGETDGIVYRVAFSLGGHQ